ncbi:glycosyltransferase family 2 protein [Pseudomonas sp. QD4]|uniref:glycosyltransferase family 2 protein n=1 Tax=Pseudomonas sp. QD4 TaxID=3368618 RepID=UPI003BA1C7C8
MNNKAAPLASSGPAIAQVVNNERCDVIIVNYNAGRLLLDCIRSLRSDRISKIIVVDNNSSDESLAPLSSLADERLIVIKNEQNLGFSVACNIGTEYSSSELLLFLNPDCIVEPEAISQLVEVLESEKKIGMVGGFLANIDGTEQPGGRRFFPTPERAFMRAFGVYKLSRFFPSARLDFSLHRGPLPTEATSVDAISGACMMVKRESIEQVGLWDEGYFLHCEDLDWCMRFKQHGLSVMFVPYAKVTHAWRACSKSRPFFVEWHKHGGMLRFYKKFFKQKYSAPLWWLVVLGVFIRGSLVFAYYGVRLLREKIGGRRG